MRVFVAAVPPEGAVEDLDAFLAVRRDAAPFRWTPADQLHLTLAFAAELPEHRLDEAVERLASAAARHRTTQQRIAGGGAFPHPDRARVLWAGLAGPGTETTGADELGHLAAAARAALATAGARVDGQRFRPHLTVARLGRPANVTPWVRLLDAYAGPAWPLEEIALVASYLGEGPRRTPRHEVLETFALSP